jgi:hypothetical protein
MSVSGVAVVPVARWWAWSLGASCGASQELDGVGDDLDGLALGAVLALPLAPVEASVDGYRPAFSQVATFYPRARFSWQAKSELRQVTAKLVTGCGRS